MKFNLLIITVFIFSVSNAQIKKGNLFIGGEFQLGISKSTNGNTNNGIIRYTSFGISPSIGWVTKDNLVVGASIVTNFSSSNYSNSDSYSKSNRIGAGFWVRKYLPLGKSFYLFGNGMLSVQSLYSINSNPQPGYYKEKGYAINAFLVPGIAYQINKSLFLEAALNNLVMLGYETKSIETYQSNVNDTKWSANSFNLSSGIGSGTPLQVGIRWMIARK